MKNLKNLMTYENAFLFAFLTMILGGFVVACTMDNFLGIGNRIALVCTLVSWLITEAVSERMNEGKIES